MTNSGEGSLSSPIVIDDSDDEDDARLVAEQLRTVSPSPSRSLSESEQQDAVPPADTWLNADNEAIREGKGFDMLLRMGFKPGLGLGPNLEGTRYPVRSNVKGRNLAGLGAREPSEPPEASCNTHPPQPKRLPSREEPVASTSRLEPAPEPSKSVPKSHPPVQQSPQFVVQQPTHNPHLLNALHPHPVHLADEFSYPDTPIDFGHWPGEGYGGVVADADWAFAEMAYGSGYFDNPSLGMGGFSPMMGGGPFFNPMAFPQFQAPPQPMFFPQPMHPLPPKPPPAATLKILRKEPKKSAVKKSKLTYTITPSSSNASVASSSALPSDGGELYTILFSADNHVIGTVPEAEHDHRRGYYPELLTPPPGANRTLVMDVLPRKFRSLAFVYTWLSQFDGPRPLRVRVPQHGKGGQAIIEFHDEAAALRAWNSPRMAGNDGLHNVRLWWYRPNPALAASPMVDDILPPAPAMDLSLSVADDTTQPQEVDTLLIPADNSTTEVEQSLPQHHPPPLPVDAPATIPDTLSAEMGSTHIVHDKLLSLQPSDVTSSLSSTEFPVINADQPQPASSHSDHPHSDPNTIPATLPEIDLTSTSLPSSSMAATPPRYVSRPLSNHTDEDMDISSSPPSHRSPFRHFHAFRVEPNAPGVPNSSANRFSPHPIPIAPPPLRTDQSTSPIMYKSYSGMHSPERDLQGRNLELQAKVAQGKAEMGLHTDFTMGDSEVLSKVDEPTTTAPNSEGQAKEEVLRRMVLLSKRKREGLDAPGLSPSNTTVRTPLPRSSASSPPPSQGSKPSSAALDALAVSFISDAIARPPPAKRPKTMAIASMAARREQLEASIQRMKDLMKQLDAAQTKKDKQAIRMLIKKQRVLADPAFTVGKEVAFVSPWPETTPVVIDLSDSEDDASDSDDMEL